ncbi:YcaO-like family protein [Verrucosispora sioxanthis]|uniref:YcaO-like family protein n=1 Tax=Verrucosispora sioxanthis TaxID=2499994 RepID=A0A6M1L623_9ACTN|nr:YcaO-like family protein [Verrucosispora sioxanthis]NEE64444.1 YcaO-like family protein [Verrucosispora sioxanthis]NGM13554.1 YcaO-like family protein [Verrucosispora sioxanthis]
MGVAAMTGSAGKGHLRGTHRLVPPEQTWAAIRPLLSVFGITRIADVTGLDDLGIPVYQAIRPASATLAVSQGKGVTHDLAKVSAAMEMIEFAHAERVTLPTARGPATECGDGSYGLRELQLVAGSLVSDTVVLDWLQGRTVLSGRTVPVPKQYVEMSNEFRREWAPPLFETSTNGLASGNCLDEAVLHGLYELIERDCLSGIEGMPRSTHTRVDPETIHDDDCQWLMARFRAADNWFEIVDATNDLDLPCYVVNLWSPSFPVLVSGSGCHLDPAVALNRALTEAAQSRLAIISGTRESIPEQVYLLQHVRQERPPPPGDDVPTVAFTRPDRADTTLADDLTAVAEQLVRRRGREPFYVDLGLGHEAIAVAKVVAPGLRFEAAHGLVERVGPR